MELKEFAEIVRDMRKAQKAAERERTPRAIQTARSWELACDVAVTMVADGPTLADVPHEELLRLADDGNPHAAAVS